MSGNIAGVFVSKLDNKKLLVIVSIVVVALMADSQIAIVADFIPDMISSGWGMALFIAVAAIFAVGQYFIVSYVKQRNKEIRASVLYHRVVHTITIAAQYVLVAIIAIVIIQMLSTAQYNSALLSVALSISYGLWIVTLSLLARGFLSWYGSSKRSIMVLILALSMIAYIVNGVTGLIYFLAMLQEQNAVVTSADVAIFPAFDTPSLTLINTMYQIAGGIAYVLTWIGTVMLLRSNIKRLGKVKFWAVMGGAMIYYMVQTPLFVLGWYTPSENSDAMTNILIFTLASVFAGVVFAAAFLSVARTLEKGNALRNHLMIAAYGLLLFYIAGSAMVSQAAYPPFGLASVSFTGLSCYLIYTGLYSSAISVSQDTTLRQSIRKSVMEQSKLLDSIGTAQMEREMQNRVLRVAKKASDSMAKETGVKSSMTEDDIKEYMEVVMNELHDKR